MPNKDAVLHFSVIDLNKRGGKSTIDKGMHIRAYCKRYSDFICKEIEIISPDIVAIIGTGLYDMGIHTDYLRAIDEEGKCYFLIGNKRIPILRLYQTSYYQGRGAVAAGYEDNLIIGRQVAKCLSEMERFALL